MEFQFSQHSILEDFIAKLPLDNSKCLGLITYGQDFFYLWDGKSQEVHTVNLKHSLRESVWDQEVVLRPKRQLLFEVEKLLLNSSCTLLCLYGPCGVAALHLPDIWGKEECVDVACVPLAERVFQGEQFKLRSVKWHPGSPTDSHLVVLTSDEYLRCFNVLNGTMLWSCLLSKHTTVSHHSIPNRISLGDTPVCFDFVPPAIDEDVNAINWPILVLWGNGNIFLASTSLRSEKPTIHGPLLMSPPSDDNYGSDASSLLVLNSSPPLIVLVTSSGTIYHSLLLSSEDSENPHDVCLCVIETVEFDLGLSVGDDDDVISCPISLMPDPVELSRYFCVHKGGLHSITVPLMAKLFEFSKDFGNDFSTYKTSSIVEYLLCTAVSSSRSYECSPLLGVTFIDLTMSIFALLATGKLVDVKLIPSVLYSVQNMIAEEVQAQENGKGLQFTIDSFLRDGGISSQPLMKLPSTTSPQAWLELVRRTSQHFENVMKTHEKVAFLLESRVTAVSRTLKDQISEICRLQEERSKLQESAETIAEKYEDMNEKHSVLMGRVEEILKHAYVQGPGLSQKEKNASDALQYIKNNFHKYEQDLTKLKSMLEYQNAFNKEASVALSNQKKFYIDDSKCRTLRKELSEFSTQLHSLSRRVEEMKDIMISEGLMK